jgi:hypothetical protein
VYPVNHRGAETEVTNTMADMDKYECQDSEEHYWVDSDDMNPHCRRKPNA